MPPASPGGCGDCGEGGRAGTREGRNERTLSYPGLCKVRGPSGDQAAGPSRRTARPPRASPDRPPGGRVQSRRLPSLPGAPLGLRHPALPGPARAAVLSGTLGAGAPVGGPLSAPRPRPSAASPEPACGIPGVRPRPEVRFPPAPGGAALAAPGAGVSVGITPSAPAGQSRVWRHPSPSACEALSCLVFSPTTVGGFSCPYQEDSAQLAGFMCPGRRC